MGHNAGDMFGQMRLALQWLCMAEAESVLAQGLNPSSLTVSARDALEWGTINGARALGLDGEIGSLTPGKRGTSRWSAWDGISLAGWQEDDPAVAVVAYAAPADVDTVLVAGRPVKRDGCWSASTSAPRCGASTSPSAGSPRRRGPPTGASSPRRCSPWATTSRSATRPRSSPWLRAAERGDAPPS